MTECHTHTSKSHPSLLWCIHKPKRIPCFRGSGQYLLCGSPSLPPSNSCTAFHHPESMMVERRPWILLMISPPSNQAHRKAYGIGELPDRRHHSESNLCLPDIFLSSQPNPCPVTKNTLQQWHLIARFSRSAPLLLMPPPFFIKVPPFWAHPLRWDPVFPHLPISPLDAGGPGPTLIFFAYEYLIFIRHSPLKHSPIHRRMGTLIKTFS